MTLKRGDVLPNPEVLNDDDWLVLYVRPDEVTVADLASFEVYRWTMARDGIHAAVTEVTFDGKYVDSAWTSVPVTINPPPREVAEYLRSAWRA
jgi:hypothetical protein